jgi:hypothetical protein
MRYSYPCSLPVPTTARPDRALHPGTGPAIQLGTSMRSKPGSERWVAAVLACSLQPCAATTASTACLHPAASGTCIQYSPTMPHHHAHHMCTAGTLSQARYATPARAQPLTCTRTLHLLQGGFSEVLLASDPLAQRRVALKVVFLNKQGLSSDQVRPAARCCCAHACARRAARSSCAVASAVASMQSPSSAVMRRIDICHTEMHV